MRILLVLLVLIAALMVSSVLASSQDDLAPYIYYHSEALNAIVIERADGTDSRAIARGLMPEDHNSMGDFAWSPSGEWLVWTSVYQPHMGYRPPASLWLFNADGERRLSILDDMQNVEHVSWSSAGDYLLVIQSFYEQDKSTIWLIDASQQRVITHFDYAYLHASPLFRYWSVDGMSIQIPYDDNVRVVYIDGRIEDNVSEDQRPPIFPPIEPTWIPPECVSPDGRYEFVPSPDYDNYYIADLTTGERIDLLPASAATHGMCDVIWHPESAWVLVRFEGTWAGGGCDTIATNVVSADGRTQRELGSDLWFRDKFPVDWLPERVIQHLLPGAERSVMPDPVVSLVLEEWIIDVGWQPDGSRLATLQWGSLTLWDATVDPPVMMDRIAIPQCGEPPLWPCRIIWNDTGTHIGLTGIYGSYVIEVQTGDIVATSTSEWIASISPDGEPAWVPPYRDVHPENQQVLRVNWQSEIVEIISAISGEILYQVELGDSEYSADTGAFIPGTDDILLISSRGRSDYQAVIWNPVRDTWEPIPLELFSDVTRFLPVGSETLFVYDRLRLLTFWDMESWTVLARLNRYTSAVDLSPDGTRLATGSGYRVEIWDYPAIIDQLRGE